MSDHKRLAGELILACGDTDGAALLKALHGVRELGDSVSVMLALAETAASGYREVHGDGWRDAVNLAVLDASVEGVDRDGLGDD